MDYERLIDEETWAFISQTGECYPEDAVDLSVDEQRKLYNEMAREFHVPHPSLVRVENETAGDVPVRIYTAGDPSCTVLFCHGGGFVVGDLDSHDDLCAEICAQTGYRVISVDYRLAPEHHHPAMFEDALAALEWVMDRFSEGIVLFGDSAGANLCAALAHDLRARPKLARRLMGQVLVYGAFGGDVDAGSYVEHAHAPMLTREEILYYMNVRTPNGTPDNDPTFAPLQDSDFTGLPPTICVTADCDPVRDDSSQYCSRIQSAGGKAHWINEAGLVHGYLRARHTVGRARDSFERISIAIEALGQGIWPYD